MITDKLDYKKWSNFVCNHQQGNIFQSPELFEIYKNTNNYRPLVVALLDEYEEVIGLLLAVIQKEYSGLIGKFTARSIIIGGPLLKSNDSNILENILSEYNSLVKKHAIYTQIRCLWNWGNLNNIFINMGFLFEEHLNILIDLTKSEELLWKELHSKRRNEIRKAYKEGLIFEVCCSNEELIKSYKILEEVYDRAKLPLPNYDYFVNLSNTKNANFKLHNFVAKYEGKIVGTMLALGYNGTLYDYYAGAYSSYYNKNPNDLIPWEVFLWGKKNGYILFDFGGAGKPGIPYGVRDYKKKFGGVFVNFGRYTKVHSKILMWIGITSFKIWKIIK